MSRNTGRNNAIRPQFFILCMLYSLAIFQICACRNPVKKVMAKNKDGSISVVYELPDKNDTLNFVMKIYYPNGRLQRMATVVNGKYSGKIITFWPSGKVYQVDSLYQPCDMNVRDCNEILYRYNENGSISQQFTVAGGSLNGLSRHYNGNGVLVKEYYLINDSIKDGDYKEYFEK